MLAETQGIADPLPALQKLADDALARDTAALVEAAHADRSDEAARRGGRRRSLSDRRRRRTCSPLADASRRPSFAQFLIDHQIVSVPGDGRRDGQETPPAYQRWNAAFLDGRRPVRARKSLP